MNFRIWPAVLRQSIYGTIKFGTYYSLKKILNDQGYFIDENGNESIWGNAICAITAGAISSAIANPTDVLKVRMQIEGTRNRNSLLSCFVEMYRTEGVRGLWRVSSDTLVL